MVLEMVFDSLLIRALCQDVCVCITALLLLLTAITGFRAGGQSADTRPTVPTSYDVVSIKLESQDPPAIGIRYTETGFEAYAVTLVDLIKAAYGLPDVRLVKGASKIELKYHIMAKLTDSDAATLRALSPQELSTERQLLLQAVLASRFQLAVHHANSPLGIYSLQVAKRGLKLQSVTMGDGGNSTASQTGAESFFSEGRIVGVFSMGRLAHILSLMRDLSSDGVDRMVVDDTGLSGQYRIDLAWTGPSVTRPTMVSQTTEVYGSVSSALDQAGLRLVSKTIDADSIVVDHASPASPD